MQELITNKVAQSGLVTIDLEQYRPKGAQLVFDVKDYLLHGYVLQEKPFRDALKNLDWQPYHEAHVGVFCSTDAIVPTWAYMLVGTYLKDVAQSVFFANGEQLTINLYQKALEAIDFSAFEGKRMVIKGCGDQPIPAAAYLQVTLGLMPYAKSIMYGEPCSTVPVFKQK